MVSIELKNLIRFLVVSLFFSTRRENLSFEEGFEVKSVESIYFSLVRIVTLFSVILILGAFFPFHHLHSVLYYELFG